MWTGIAFGIAFVALVIFRAVLSGTGSGKAAGGLWTVLIGFAVILVAWSLFSFVSIVRVRNLRAAVNSGDVIVSARINSVARSWLRENAYIRAKALVAVRPIRTGFGLTFDGEGMTVWIGSARVERLCEFGWDEITQIERATTPSGYRTFAALSIWLRTSREPLCVGVGDDRPFAPLVMREAGIDSLIAEINTKRTIPEARN